VCRVITRESGELAVLVAFDMFGTLADTASVTRELAPFCGDMAGGVARTWRDKQLRRVCPRRAVRTRRLFRRVQLF
jgi:hypothetical protein